jgi:hypothetical protein
MSKTFQITEQGMKEAALEIRQKSYGNPFGKVQTPQVAKIILTHCQAQPEQPDNDDFTAQAQAAIAYQTQDTPTCSTCKSKCRDARHALATDSKRLDLCNDPWHTEAGSSPAPKPDKDIEDKLRAAGFYQVWRDPQTDLLYQSAEVALMKINTVGPAPQPAPKECTLNPNTCECGFCDWPKCNEE